MYPTECTHFQRSIFRRAYYVLQFGRLVTTDCYKKGLRRVDGPKPLSGRSAHGPLAGWLIGKEGYGQGSRTADQPPPFSVIHVPFGHCGLLLLLGVEHFGQKIKLINFDLLK